MKLLVHKTTQMKIKWQLISKYPGINSIRVHLQDAGATSCDSAFTVNVKLHFVFGTRIVTAMERIDLYHQLEK